MMIIFGRLAKLVWMVLCCQLSKSLYNVARLEFPSFRDEGRIMKGTCFWNVIGITFYRSWNFLRDCGTSRSLGTQYGLMPAWKWEYFEGNNRALLITQSHIILPSKRALDNLFSLFPLWRLGLAILLLTVFTVMRNGATKTPSESGVIQTVGWNEPKRVIWALPYIYWDITPIIGRQT